MHATPARPAGPEAVDPVRPPDIRKRLPESCSEPVVPAEPSPRPTNGGFFGDGAIRHPDRERSEAWDPVPTRGQASSRSRAGSHPRAQVRRPRPGGRRPLAGAADAPSHRMPPLWCDPLPSLGNVLRAPALSLCPVPADVLRSHGIGLRPLQADRPHARHPRGDGARRISEADGVVLRNRAVDGLPLETQVPHRPGSPQPASLRGDLHARG